MSINYTGLASAANGFTHCPPLGSWVGRSACTPSSYSPSMEVPGFEQVPSSQGAMYTCLCGTPPPFMFVASTTFGDCQPVTATSTAQHMTDAHSLPPDPTRGGFALPVLHYDRRATLNPHTQIDDSKGCSISFTDSASLSQVTSTDSLHTTLRGDNGHATQALGSPSVELLGSVSAHSALPSGTGMRCVQYPVMLQPVPSSCYLATQLPSASQLTQMANPSPSYPSGFVVFPQDTSYLSSLPMLPAPYSGQSTPGMRSVCTPHTNRGGPVQNMTLPYASPNENLASCSAGTFAVPSTCAPTYTMHSGEAVSDAPAVKRPASVHVSLSGKLRFVSYATATPATAATPTMSNNIDPVTTNPSWPLGYSTAPNPESPTHDDCWGTPGVTKAHNSEPYARDHSAACILPVYIQMFPCELRDQAVAILNRVIEATCGPAMGTVIGTEPRSDTSFIAMISTREIFQLIYRLRCRVLMDRLGFWYAENMDQYKLMKAYCESVRRLPQQARHFQTDGLPCMPLVVELGRMVNADTLGASPAPPSFDEVLPMNLFVRRFTYTREGRQDGRGGSCCPRDFRAVEPVIGCEANQSGSA